MCVESDSGDNWFAIRLPDNYVHIIEHDSQVAEFYQRWREEEIAYAHEQGHAETDGALNQARQKYADAERLLFRALGITE